MAGDKGNSVLSGLWFAEKGILGVTNQLFRLRCAVQVIPLPDFVLVKNPGFLL